MKTTIVILSLVLSSTAVAHCSDDSKTTHTEKQSERLGEKQLGRVDVLNLGVFHLAGTSDAHSVKYDPSTAKNVEQILSVCRKLARFKPTVICVEIEPTQQPLVDREYEKYLKDPSIATQFADSEVQLLGFEIGRLANTRRMVAIDHRMGYDFLGEFAKQIAADEYTLIRSGLEARVKELLAPVTSLQQTLLKLNTQESYDLLININADVLVFANSKNGFEGADEAAKCYHRNLRMFANINKISLDGSDRVLIISGGNHGAYFNMFMKRSPRYRLVQIETFLK